MVDHTITHTIRDATAGARGVAQPTGKVAGTVRLDPASLRKLNKAFQDAISKSLNLKTLSDTIANAMSKKLGTAMPKGGSAVSSKSDINRIVKQVSSDLVKQISQSLTKALTQSTTPTKAGVSDKRIVDALSGLDKHIQNSINKLNTEVKKQTGKQLGPDVSKSIANAITGSLEKTIPKSLGQATKDLSKAVSSIQIIVKEVASIAMSIRKMRQTGGVDITEIRPIITNLKELTSEFKKLPGEIKQARESAKTIAKEEKQLYDNFSKALTDLRKSTREKVTGVKQRAVEDPRKFAKIIAAELSRSVKAMPALRGTRIESVLTNLDKKVEGIGDVGKAFKGVEKELKAQIKGGKISVESLSSLLKTIELLNTNLKDLPKTIEISGEVSSLKGLEAFIKRTERFLKTLERFSITIDVKDIIALKKLAAEQARKGVAEGLKKGVKEGLNPVIEDIVAEQAEKGIIKGLEAGVKKTKPKVAVSTAPTKSGEYSYMRKVQQDYVKEIGEAYKNIGKAVSEKMIEGGQEAIQRIGGLLTEFQQAYVAKEPGKIKEKLYELKEIPELKELRNLIGDMIDSISLFNASIGPGTEKFKVVFDKVECLVGDIEDVGDILKGIRAPAKKAANEFDKVGDVLKSTTNALEDIQERSKRIALGTVGTAKARLEAYKIYKYPKQVLPPVEKEAEVRFEEKVKPEVKYGEKAKKAVESNVEVLAKSLKELQLYMASRLGTELEKGSTGWQIVRESSEQVIDEYFKLATGGALGNIKAAGKQWTLQIADVKKLRDRLGRDYAAVSPPKLLEAYKEELMEEEVGRRPAEVWPTLIAKWVKTSSEENIRGMSEITDVQKDAFVKLRKEFPGTKVAKEMAEKIETLLGSSTEIERVFKRTFASLEAERRMVEKTVDEFGRMQLPVLKTLAIPAAKLTEMGTAVFETAAGAERAIPKFAVFKTGFERLHEMLIEAKAIKPGETFGRRIKEIGVRPAAPAVEAVGKPLAREMLAAIKPVVGREKLVGYYERAATMKGVELKRAGVIEAIPEFEDKIRNAIDVFKALPETGKSISDFMNAMDAVGLSAYDVVKSLDQLKFEDVYKVLGRIVEKPLKGVAEAPRWDRPIRQFEDAIRQLEQLLPLIEPGRPRRGTHQEAIVQLLTRTTPLYRGINVGLSEQKDLIKDINLRLGEMVEEAKALREAGAPGAAERLKEIGIPETIRALSTLGVPESLAGKIEPMAKKGEYLGALNAITMKLYTENLRELAPFGAQFQAWQRNITNVTNAMSSMSEETAEKLRGFGAGVKGVGTEFPTLRTEREREMISGGRYGRGGYGFNVLAELRTTASTFEDQVMISGKIADALTSITKTLVKPGIAGRLRKFREETVAGVTEIEPKLLRDVEQSISGVSTVIQEVLGMPEKYRGRADKALIESVTKAVTVARGADIEVQAAKIAEVFLNYFGRKITTRYGAKGVAVTPSNLREVLEYYGEKKMKVLPKAERTRAGLGIAVMPKTMGQLASEILAKEAEKLEETGMAPANIKRLSTAVVTSGNKFMLDMFKQAGVIAEDEISVQRGIFTKLQNALKQLDIDLASDIEGIERLKKVYKEKVGKELYVERPIDIRISAAGVAKRGLQTDVLEAVMANIIGAGPGGVTTMKTELPKEVYEKMLVGKKVPGKVLPKPGMLSKYAEALGFEAALTGKDREAAYQQLVKEFTEKFGKGKEDIARRAAELEALSSFYVEVVDELQKQRKGLVGRKFVSIIEEPHLYPEWETKAIEKGVKGEKLDLPAFAAYAAIFGEQSEFMKEIKKSSTIDTKEAWEYIKALQTVNKQSAEFTKLLMTPLKTVDLLDIKDFTEASGTLEDFKGTLLDIQKFPAAFKVKIPQTVKGAKKAYEELYVPGALARGTYEEPLIAGERAPKTVARRLMHLISMAQRAEAGRTEFAEIEKQIDELNQQLEKTEDITVIATINDRLAELTQKLGELYGAPENIEKIKQSVKSSVGVMARRVSELATAREGEEEILEIIGTLIGVISETKAPAPGLRTRGVAPRLPEAVHAEKFLGARLGPGKDPFMAYVATVGRMADMIIGVGEQSRGYLRDMENALSKVKAGELKADVVTRISRKIKVPIAKPEEFKRALEINIKTYKDRLAAVPTVERAAEAGELASLAKKLGTTMEVSEEEHERALAALTKAKIDYYNTLAETILGKKGAVAEVLFARKIPAVMGKAIAATVDKTEELKQFAVALRKISKEGGELRLGALEAIADDILKIEAEHAKNVEKYREELKLPVLKEYELGVPEAYAKKIPVEFTKKFGVTKEVTKKGTLYELMQYEEKLEDMLKSLEKAPTAESRDLQQRIKEHLDKEVVAYIESVRYPFTGISSVQPYKPRLMKGELAKHALAVPGMPEMDIEQFDKLLEKVKDIRRGFEEERKRLGEEPVDIQKRKELSDIIDELNRAISAVLPRYLAHQQKLDFDGDAIEIHSATTDKARQDIKKHFDSLAGDIESTRAVFRDFFTYEAKQIPTGKYPLGEMAATFEKKFPAEKGFEFLRKPYLTRELEYLKPAEQLEILAKRPKAESEAKILENIVKEVAKTPEEEVQALDAIKQAEEKGATSLIKAIEGLGGNLEKLVKEGIKTRTFEEKYKDALEAQLYKIHTGPETEQLYRLVRMAEMTTGFAGGQIAPGTESRATESFKKRWPKIKALGAEPVYEFQTMINELLRFGIQKGMDVKHAGEFPVAGMVVKELSKGEKAAENLFDTITDKNEESFAELRDFVDRNKIAIERRLARLTLPELKEQAVELRKARGIEAAPVGREMGREDVVQDIVRMVGFRGFLVELAKQIREEAVEGLIKEMTSLPLAKRPIGARTDIKAWATSEITRQMAKPQGISIRELITAQRQPLYMKRVFGAAPGKELAGFEKRKGRMPEPEFAALPKTQQKELVRKYKETQATAMNIAEELRIATKEMGGGAYAQMVTSAIENIYAEQERIQTELLSKLKEPTAFKVPEAPLMERVLKGVDVTELARSIIGDPEKVGDELEAQMSDKFIGEMKRAVEEYSNLVGVSLLTAAEKFEIEYDALESFVKKAEAILIEEGMDPGEFEQEVSRYAQAWTAKACALAQIDKITEVLKTKKYEERLLLNILPTREDIKEKLTKQIVKPAVTEKAAMTSTEREAMVERYVPRMKEKVEELRGIAATKAAVEKGILPRGAKDCVPIVNCGGKPLDVNIVNIGDVGQAGALTATLEQQLKEAMPIDVLGKQLEELRKMRAEIVGVAKKSVTYEGMYRGSGLEAGGMYEQRKYIFKPGATDVEALGRSQVQAIMEQMLGIVKETPELEASALLGTALHAKIEKELEKRLGEKVETEKFVKYRDETVGDITGHIDAVFKNAAGEIEKVMDIKTVGDKLISDLKSGKFGEYTKQKIEEVTSQINFYLAAIVKETGQKAEDIMGEVRFYSQKAPKKEPAIVKIKFDPERLTRDIEAIRKSRELIQKYILEESSLEGIDIEYKKVIENVRRKLKEREVKYAPASSIEDLAKLNEDLQKVTDEQIEVFVKSATEYKKALKKGIPSRRAPISPREEMMAGRETVRIEKKVRAAAEEEIDVARFQEPPKMAEGDLNVLYKNLVSFHTQAKVFQKMYEDIDYNAVFETLHEDVQALLREAVAKGKATGAGPQLVDLLKKLQDQGIMTQVASSKVWKMYRMAVGDFFLQEAASAKKAMKDAGDDWAAANKAYAAFKSNIDKFREYIVESLGKQTDIYTFRAGYGKEFWTPELAKAAEVYLPPEEIMRKAGGPLGEDERLRVLFKKMVEDVAPGEELKPPIFKAREVVANLTNISDGLVSVLNNADLVKRKGEEFSKAWDFSGLIGDVTRLRAALQGYLRFNLREDFTAEQRKNLEDTLTYLKQIERTFSKFGKAKPSVAKWGEMGTAKVLPWLEPKTQLALHKRNIAAAREYFKKAQEGGGPEVGERFTYMVKILDQTGSVLKNTAYDFHKYGEFVNKAGEATGAFSEKQRDLMIYTQGANRTFRSALRRVAMWGGAATLVYGGIAKLKDMIGTLADVEMGVAQLRMVMSPLETDFGRMQEAAITFAKQYGVPMTDVLKGMRIFAQQGLKQEEVIDRTRTATIASNVSTLNAKDATEAITAASKVFRQEGESTLRFIDAWSEVEAKHAITSEDMALALRKAASAGKNAGFTFDELNGVIASIGSVTRQTGREVGTSLRFIFRRLAAEKGPKELAKLGIPVLTEAGELRKGYDILGDLASQWKDLTSAQKMSIAQSIGGTRQYNQLLVLMDNWKEAVSATRDSINSKGSAERRNLEVMKTYTKQLEQTRQAAVEVQMEFGKIYLPISKFSLKGIKFLLESLTAIPMSVKAAGVGLALLVTYIAKGDKLLTGLATSLGKGSTLVSEFFGAFRKGTKVAGFEVFGRGKGPEFEGLKRIGEGKSMRDFHSALGKTAYLVTEAGTAYNKFIGNIVVGSGKIVEKVGETTESVGKSFTTLSSTAAEAYGGYAGIMGMLSKQGFKGLLTSLPKMLGPVAIVGTEVAGQATKYAGKAIDTFGEKMGGMGQKFLKEWAGQNTGFVKATAPMIASIAALVPALKAVYDYYGKTTKSAQDYEKSMYGIRRANESELSTIRSLIKEYDSLSDRLDDIREAAKPEVKARRMELGTYEAPLLTLGDLQKDAIDTSNKLAETNISLVAGYDGLGNAVLKTVGNFKEYLKTIEKLKIKEMAKTEVNVLEKYIKDLTEIEGPEKWKFELKKLLKEAPVFGEIIGKHIKISPAKALDEVTKSLNALITLKTKYPISTAFDKDIKKYQTSLKEVRKGFSATYIDFRKVLSEIPTAGLGRGEIAKLLGKEELRKGYELMVEVEPRFKLVPSKEIEIPDSYWRDITRTMKVKTGVKWQDVLGTEVMKRVFPGAAPVLDVSSVLTKARLETKGIKPRLGKALSGDIITFLDDVVWEYDMAGKQAILSLKKTSDGIFEWMVTYFNTKTLDVEERPFTKDMQQLVNNIFPQKAIEEDLSERIQVFNEFVAGAAAGLRGVSAKEFKREFALGERFFAEVPTTTILQGPRGYVPGPGGGEFGVSPFQKEWKETTQEFFFKPMREYRQKAEQLEKLRLEGLEKTGGVTVATGLYEGLVKLQEVLKNNQIVLQYRAVFVDLTKTIEQSTRAMQENLVVEKSRLELEKVASGYMKGIPEGLEALNTGVQRFGELTARQRALVEVPEYRRGAVRLRGAEIKGAGAREQVYAIDRALVALESIREVSKGFGAAMTPEDMKKYTEVVARTGESGTAELVLETSKVTENTAFTVDRLDKILENMGDEAAIEELLTKFTDRFAAGAGGFFGGAEKTVNALERVARVRGKYREEGNREVVIAANKTLDILSKNLVQQVGLKKGMEKVGSNFTVFGKKFTAEEFAQRAFGGGIDLKTFIDRMDKEVPEVREGFDWRRIEQIAARPVFAETKETKKLLQLQKEDNKTQLISSKTLIKAGAALTVFEHFNKSHSNAVIKNLEDQAKKVTETVKIDKAAGKDTEELSGKLEAIEIALTKERKRLDFHKMVQAVSVVSTGTMAFAKALGLTEGQIKLLGVGAISTYAAVKAVSSIMGTDIPESAKEFEKTLKDVSQKILVGEKVGWKESRKLKAEGKEYVKAYHEELKKTTGVSTEELKKTVKEYARETPGVAPSKIREKAGRDEDTKRLRQLLLTYATATMAGYAAEAQADKTRLATLNKRAEEQAEIFAEIIEKYPEEAEKVIQEMHRNVEEMRKEGKRVEAPTETKTLVLETEKARKEVKKNMEEIRKDFVEKSEQLNKEMGKVADRMAKLEIAKQFEMELEEMEKAVDALEIGAVLRRKLDVETAGLLVGKRRPAPIEFGVRAVTEMSPEEFLGTQKTIFERLGGTFKTEWPRPIDALKNFLGRKGLVGAFTPAARREKLEEIEEKRGIKRAKLEEYGVERAGLERRRGFFGGGLSVADEERYQLLGSVINDLTSEVEGLTEAIKESKGDLRSDIVKAEIELFERAKERDYEVAKAVGALEDLLPGRGLLAGGPAISAKELDFGPRTFRELTPYQVAMQTASREAVPERTGYFENLWEEIFKDFEKKMTVGEAFWPVAKALVGVGREEITEGTVLKDYEESLERQASLMGQIREATERIVVLDFEGQSNEADQWRESLEEAKEKLKEVNETLRETTLAAKGEIDAAKQLQRVRERVIDSLARIEHFNIDRFFGNIPTVLSKALRGFPGEVALPPTKREMTPQQLLYATGGPGVKSALASYKLGTEQLRAQAAEIAKLADIRRDEIQPILGLIEAGSANKSVIEQQINSCKSLNEEQKEVIRAYNIQREALEKQAIAIRNVVDFMGFMKTAADALTRIEVTEAVEEMPGVKGAREMAAKLYGGAHPAARVAVSVEQRRMGLTAGVSLEHLKSTKYQVRQAELLNRLMQNLDPQAYMDTIQAMIDMPEQEKSDIEAYNQSIQNRKIFRQKDMYEQSVHNLQMYKKTHELSAEQIKSIDGVIGAYDTAVGTMLKDISRDEKLQELKKLMETTTDPEKLKGLEKDYTEVARLGVMQFRGVFGEARIGVEEAETKAMEMFADKIIKGQEGALKFAVANPIVARIETTNTLLRLMAEYLKIDKEKIEAAFPGRSVYPKEIVPSVPGWGVKHPNIYGLYGAGRSILESMYAPGGYVSGLGGPREDKVPIWASPGEYVIRQAAARRLGYDNLEYMNEEGRIPGFAEGGVFSHLGKSGLQVLASPARAVLDMSKPMAKIIDRLGFSTGEDLELLEKRLTFMEESQYVNTDTILKALTLGKIPQGVGKLGSVSGLSKGEKDIMWPRIFQLLRGEMYGSTLSGGKEGVEVISEDVQYAKMVRREKERRRNEPEQEKMRVHTSRIEDLFRSFDLGKSRQRQARGLADGGEWTKEDEERAKKYGRVTTEPKKGIWEKAKDFMWGMVPFHQYMTEEGRMLTEALPAEASAQQKFGEFTKLLDFLVGSETAIAGFGKKIAGKGFLKKVLTSQKSAVGFDISDIGMLPMEDRSRKLLSSIAKAKGKEGFPQVHAMNILDSKYADDIIAEIPVGGKLTGYGTEALVFKASGSKNVTRVSTLGRSVERPDVPFVLQASRTKSFGDIYVETLPKVETVTDDFYVDIMKHKLRGSGYEFSDPHPANLGISGDAGLVITDPGAWRKLDKGGLVGSEKEQILTLTDISQTIKEWSKGYMGATEKAVEPKGKLSIPDQRIFDRIKEINREIRGEGYAEWERGLTSEKIQRLIGLKKEIKAREPVETIREEMLGMAQRGAQKEKIRYGIAEIPPFTPEWKKLREMGGSEINAQVALHNAWKLLHSGKVTDREALGSLESFVKKQNEMLRQIYSGEVSSTDPNARREYEKLAKQGQYYSALQRVSFYRELERIYGKDWIKKTHPDLAPTPDNMKRAAQQVRRGLKKTGLTLDNFRQVSPEEIKNFHHGGYVQKTGPAFVEKGEFVVPKKFVGGGIVEFDKNVLNGPVGGINVEDLSGKLKEAMQEAIDSAEFPELKTEELPRLEVNTDGVAISVDTTDATVPVDTAGATVPVDTVGVTVPVDTAGATVSVDVAGVTIPVDTVGATVPVDTAGATVSVDVAGATVSVDTAGVTVPVDTVGATVPVDTAGATVSVDVAGVTVPVDVAGATVPVDTAGATVSVDVAGVTVPVDTTEGPNAVGAEEAMNKVEELAELVNGTYRTLIDDLGNLDNKIEEVKVTMVNKKEVDHKINVVKDSLNTEVNKVRSESDEVRRNTKIVEMNLGERVNQQDQRLGRVETLSYSL